LIKDQDPMSVFIPEEFSEEQNMIKDMVNDFVDNEIIPVREKVEGLDIELTKELLTKAGELGLLGTAFPEEYGGSMQDFVTNMLLTETLSKSNSFALSLGAHTGIGMLPILYFGTDEQKQKYLPVLIEGKKYAAYCLTEPGSGSDALNAKTKAVLSEDGKHYILNGQKMWITNAGFADVFVVFAKIDGEKFTGFIVEREWEGVSVGAEEKKLGIKGSSTRQVFFENVKVPVGNLLGEEGKGHRIAFNILNIGRIKLGAGVIGASKLVSSYSIQYANERHQFKQPISNFGAIKYKLAEQAIRIWAVESAIYRASNDIGLMEHASQEEGKSLKEALLGAAEEYAIECALMKVWGSEALDYAVDEGLQIYGGMGYSEEGPMAATYRDARINRIFEGTNEINRMLSVDMLFKKAMKGQIDMMSAAMAVQQELMSAPTGEKTEGPYGRELDMIKNMKKMFLMVAGATAQKFMTELESEQEILMRLADVMGDIYVAESAMLRVIKLATIRGEEAAATELAMARVYMDDAMERCSLNARRTVCSWAEGDMLKGLVVGVKRFAKYLPVNSKNTRREIAAKLIAENEYCF
ncbi:MAG: acyl-CoA dehydrogenase family protein, partial [Saprospiraceae bacterium]